MATPGHREDEPRNKTLSLEAPVSVCLPLGRYVLTHPRLVVIFQPLHFKKPGMNLSHISERRNLRAEVEMLKAFMTSLSGCGVKMSLEGI